MAAGAGGGAAAAMPDADRRHSVDLPLSRALVALQRVRSLRDPGTGIAELTHLVDAAAAAGDPGLSPEPDKTCRRPPPPRKSTSSVRIRRLNPPRSRLSHRQPPRRPPPNEKPSPSPSPSLSSATPAMSRAASPSNFSRSSSVGASNFSGCGISYCWSAAASKCRSLYSDTDEQPLLSSAPSPLPSPATNAATPRSISHKFRPRSFADLVGLAAVAQPLLYAAAKANVAPLYLFHGPRGTGKSSTARLFAAALNCRSADGRKPCGYCRECLALFSGTSRDVKEINAGKLAGRPDRVAALLKSAALVPYAARFKVFIVDECQLLKEDAWAAIVKSLDEPYRHAVYVMVTADIDRVPRASVARCRKFHFPKLKPADIARRLERICGDEGMEFEEEGLRLVAERAGGSLRDAETMLEQLSLLGKKITVSLVHELVGSVGEDDLIELLDLALSSDTTNTVRRARELMASSVDPLQLVSQLANLIMDILAGRSQSGLSDLGKSFFSRYAFAEVGMAKLRHALRVLSEAEKQLRTSKNQTTWVTVALLQFSTGEPPSAAAFPEPNSRLSTSYTDDWVSRGNGETEERQCRRLKMESMWERAVDKCRGKSVRSFLRREGFLLSVHVTEDMAIAEVGFGHSDHLSKADRLRNVMSEALQDVLRCTVDVRLRLVPRPAASGRDPRSRRQSFNLLSCSGRNREMLESSASDAEEEKAMPMPMPGSGGDYGADIPGRDELRQPNCFSRTLRLQKRLFSGDGAQMIRLRVQPQSKVEVAIPRKAFDAYFCRLDPYDQYSQSNSRATGSSREENSAAVTKSSRISGMLCWRGSKHSIVER